MKVLLTLLGGLIGAILSAAALTLLSDNKIAIQIGGENNTIEQKTESRPSSPQHTQTGQPVSQLPSPPTTQSSTITTQPQVTVTINNPQPSVSAPASTPIQARRPVNRPHYTETVEYEDEFACPAEETVYEDEVSGDVTYEEGEVEVEEYDCEEEPPTT